ncbi:MAG TPA: helix-turn-helix domain-containing protein [Bacteroides mediterraneensis]|uniref:helix-turn-helix domain-containing protein n=1 Tax=Bacteroidaceae TaxID=815 RepID=UPI002584C409|nr:MULTISPECIES: helix-turn-helix domain-containing protein [Bacteroidaceae]HJH65027.1 helix-turn-helix domain-containing protein [Bacteroides mediterraneensis]
MNKTIMTNDEWAVGFMEQLDSMLDGIESMNEKSKASFGNERFLTDKEVSAWLKVSRRTLQDYRNNGMVSYYQLGGKILYKESDIEKLVMGGYRNAYRTET